MLLYSNPILKNTWLPEEKRSCSEALRIQRGLRDISKLAFELLFDVARSGHVFRRKDIIQCSFGKVTLL